MEIIFKNEWGIILFAGSRQRREGFFIKSVSGLGPVEKEHTTLSYANLPGQTLVSSREMERVVTVTADICSRNHVKKFYSHLADVLYSPGELMVFSGGILRKIGCRCTHFGEPEMQGSGIMTVRLQFTCDQPFFTDEREQQVTIFSKKDLISDVFILPCVFTERTTGTVMVNKGRVSVEPIFWIYNTGLERETAETEEEYGFLFINERTGQKLKLLCHTVPGEKITVDIPARRIESSVAGNLVGSLSPDSYLCNFYLEPGENRIEVVNLNTNEDINVLMQYENRYIEAVM